ncbi:MAG: protein translocase subunit SecD [Candidatus Peribacteraceae bacterium]|nr:protein translocase subunit SecD [Candidatus Peribacteraceae bacterium]
MFKNSWLKLLLILAVVGFIALVDLPPAQKTFFEKVPLVGAELSDSKVNLGLDLQGGAHLDYRVVTKGIQTADIPNIVAGVKEVIERRVNGLGVTEPNIFESRVGDEYHIVVELAGIRDIEEAKAIVGKTIQLEFKEKNTEIDPNVAAERQAKAEDFLAQASADPDNFEQIFDDDFRNGSVITFSQDEDVVIEGETVEEGWKWVSDLTDGFKDAAEIEVGTVYPDLIEPAGEYFLDSDGSVKQKQGFYVAKLLAREDSVERVETTEAERSASHILIAYEGSAAATDTTTRTKSEAEDFANQILERAESGEDFIELAETYSDDQSVSQNSGELGFFTYEKMVPEFSEPVFAAEDFGILPEVAESDFGFHVIKYEDKKDETSTTTNEPRVKFARAFFSTAPDGWKATGLTGQHFRRADVGSDPTSFRPIVNIYFTQTAVADSSVNWWILVWYLVAITSGIALFSSLVGVFMSEGRSHNLRRDKVIGLISAILLAGAIYGIVQNSGTEEVPAPEPEVTEGEEIAETDKAGVDLFAEITKRNLGKPIAIFLDGLPIIDTNGDGIINEFDPAYAPTVQSEILNGQAVISGLASYEEANELAQNLNTGAIPAPVKLSGEYTVGATLGESALRTSLEAGILGLLAVALFVILFYRLPGLIAAMALAIYGAVLVFVLQLFGVVLTLAGVAGVILSIGMAVDANILIFERMKEELKLGKSLSRSVEDGFARAWNSIRDSNVSSLITCAILWGFGDSVIKGFGLTLGIGILISMFTAITVSRNFLRVLVSFARSPRLYGTKK